MCIDVILTDYLHSVLNIIKLIEKFVTKNNFFSILGDSNFLIIDCNNPNTNFNGRHENILTFCTDNIQTKVITTLTHKDGNILDLIVCNHLVLDSNNIQLVLL